ncbi:unnamed protein product [Cladocopium goreaui]|uniref:Protein disulfide-isomerase n=1 Tax=Cladocopium goreaui TaxID=2562237 RepID=A0A9P1DQA2_9DINO|nr:unnamed protein product [Cladocopium goreaui]
MGDMSGGGKGMGMGKGAMGMGKGYGGCGKGGGAGGQWGGCGVWQPMFNAMMMSMMGKGSGKNGLRNFTTDRKVWVSRMPADNASKEVNMKLKEHMSTAGVPCLYAEIGKSGTGGAAYKSNSEAMTACAALNGSQFEGVTLVCLGEMVTPWEVVDFTRKKEAASHEAADNSAISQSHGSHGTGRVVPPRVGFSKGSGAVSAKGAGSGKGKGAGGNWGGCGVLQPMFNAMMSVLAKGSGKAGGGLRSFAPELRVWVGGLPPNNVSKELNMKLKEHMSLAGVPCLFAEIGKSGTGGAAFKNLGEKLSCIATRTNSEALVACSTLNGSQFEGVTLHCDMWSRKT